MADLTRRKFLTGAPAVAVAVVAGVVVASKAAAPARPILAVNKTPALVHELIQSIDRRGDGEIVERWRVQLRRANYVYRKDITNITRVY